MVCLLNVGEIIRDTVTSEECHKLDVRGELEAKDKKY